MQNINDVIFERQREIVILEEKLDTCMQYFRYVDLYFSPDSEEKGKTLKTLYVTATNIRRKLASKKRSLDRLMKELE